ncbi:ATP-binding protein [Corynebacterium accolens]|uniref:ATP-binding protein n=1 Tax=Corynebacterium accolens TaxID=38284 RepID=UPI001EDA89EC|nr:ATP-binding protein [Corynebacterium accolens]MDK8592578.1 ATP-binding protein [Corynebacterium accolens]
MAPLNDATPEQLVARVNRFRSLPAELPWIEFKVNSATSGPEIARYISALGNSATLNDETAAYLIWGINDDRQIVGTSFSWQTAKGKGNEDLLPWLSRAIIPTPQLKFLDVEIGNKLVTMLRIAAPHEAPFAYEGQRHFRQGSYTKPLLNYPKVERELWQKLSQFEAETSLVAEGLTAAEVVDYLSAEAFFANRPEVPRISGTALADLFKEHGAVSYTHELGWCIPAWSALMYAHRLSDFTQLRNLGPRVLQFNGTNRTSTKREWNFDEGYALSFPKVMELFATVRPGGESIDASGRRVVTPELPRIAFREVLANALMHQNLDDSGKYLTVEIFTDRVEITNPGAPLVSPQRFIDSASFTRNPKLGEALRQAHFVEQRGSGWDKIVSALEAEHFPPALIRTNGSTMVTLSAFRTFALMSPAERIQATYQHTALGFLDNRVINNASIRKRFGLKDTQAAQATRLLNATAEEGLIRPYDPNAGTRAMRYVPFWAD